ncbi:MAG: hypothetical protein E7508_11430 [Ruminococcus sp.]|nr:hypothetical protein [Ruminococcus sp.]
MQIGPNGAVTTFPNCGEKTCVACEYWTGSRSVTYNGSAATSRDNKAALCTMKKSQTFPQQPCLCTPNKFIKWSQLK